MGEAPDELSGITTSYKSTENGITMPRYIQQAFPQTEGVRWGAFRDAIDRNAI